MRIKLHAAAALLGAVWSLNVEEARGHHQLNSPAAKYKQSIDIARAAWPERPGCPSVRVRWDDEAMEFLAASSYAGHAWGYGGPDMPPEFSCLISLQTLTSSGSA